MGCSPFRTSLGTNLLLWAAILLWPGIGSGADLKEKLEAFLLTPADLLPGWKLRKGTDIDPHFEQMVISMREYQEKSGYLFKIQRLKGGSDEFDVLVFVFQMGHTREWLEETSKKNADTYRLAFFRVGEALVLVHQQTEEAVRGLKDIFGRKIALSALEQAEKLLREKRRGEADNVLKTLVESMKESGVAHAWAGDLYFRRFSPPMPRRARELFERTIEIHKNAPVLPHVLWTVHLGLAGLHEEQKEFQGALSAYHRAVECAGRVGARLKARTLLDLARIQVGAGDPEAGFASLKESLEIETRFGSREVAGKVRNEEAFKSLLEEERLRGALEKCESASAPEVFTDPSVKKIQLRKIKILLLPPVVRNGSKRCADLEEQAEKGLLRKFKRNGAAFGGRRGVLAREGRGAFSETICRHVQGAVKEDGGFDLFQYRGNRHGLVAPVDGVLEIARLLNLSKFQPAYILALSVEIGAGSMGEGSLAVRAALVNVSSMRVTAFFCATVVASEEDRKVVLLRLGADIYRKMDSVLRSGRWK